MTRSVHLICGVAVVSLLAQACVPVAWVSPPARVETAIGASRVQSAETGRVEPKGHFDARAALAPLQLFPDLETRRADVGFGYGLRLYFPDEPLVFHGPFLEGYALFYPESVNGRMGVGAQLQALGSNRSTYALEGGRAAIRFVYEWDQFADGPFADCSGDFCGTGYAFGEGGIGFYGELSNSFLADRWEQSISLGIIARIPGTLGAGVIFINPFELLL